MTTSGQLIYSGVAHFAFGLVAGFMPTDFVMLLRRLARSGETAVQKFISQFRRVCSRFLWWPTWSAARDATGSDTEDDTGYCSANTTDDESSINGDSHIINGNTTTTRTNTR